MFEVLDAGSNEVDVVVDQLLNAANEMRTIGDVLGMEQLASTFIWLHASGTRSQEAALVTDLIPEMESRANTPALVALLALAAILDGPGGRAATAAVQRLRERDVPAPDWTNGLNAPLEVSDCQLFTEPGSGRAVLSAIFRRAWLQHGLLVEVNEYDGGVDSMFVLESVAMANPVEALRSRGRAIRLEPSARPLSPAEFRDCVEDALEARLEQERADFDEDFPASFDDPSYDPNLFELVTLVKARMRGLPMSAAAQARQEALHSALRAIDRMAASRQRKPISRAEPSTRLEPTTRPAVRPLEPTRRPAGNPAPVYQIKAGLLGSNPPIWRRLEVRGDARLFDLHAILQIAFGWENRHLYLFATPYGGFGRPEPDDGDEFDDAAVTLEQVVAGAGEQFTYSYDFGDEWQHDLMVERVLTADAALSYPRCTGGDRAAPPEDCGGIDGYQNLTDAIDNRRHPHYRRLLEWSQHNHGKTLEPKDFDVDDVNAQLLEHFRGPSSAAG
jgi:hypothetical protein